jgi:predicted PurR-regulated permease PerM
MSLSGLAALGATPCNICDRYATGRSRNQRRNRTLRLGCRLLLETRVKGLRSPSAIPPVVADDQAASHGSLNATVAWATIGIFVMLFGVVLYLTRVILIPFTAATIIAMTLAPLVRRAERRNVPSWLFAVLVIAILIAIMHVSTFLFLAPFSQWIEHLPDLGSIIRDKLHAIDSAIAHIRGVPGAPSIDDASFKIDLSTVIEPVLGFLTPAISQLVIFLAMLFFLLIGQVELRRNLILVFSGQESRLRAIRILNDIEEGLARYVATVTVINFALGLLTAIGASIIGLPNPALWGVLAFLCNFVPYVGPAFVLFVLLAVGLINFSSFGHALITPAYYLTLTTLEGHFITPNIVGKRFTLSPLAVFLALAFWTWLWGPIGGFLATPILLIAIVIFNHFFSEEEVVLPE